MGRTIIEMAHGMQIIGARGVFACPANDDHVQLANFNLTATQSTCPTTFSICRV